MAFNVQYSFNNGIAIGMATSIKQLRKALYNFDTSGNVNNPDYLGGHHYLTQCTLSGTAEGVLFTDKKNGDEFDEFRYSSIKCGLFEGFEELISVNLSNLNTKNVTNMHFMFYYCFSLTSIIFPPKFVTSNVTDIDQMFYRCLSLKSLNLSDWDTSGIDNFGALFGECDSLISLDLSNWNTSNVTTMSFTFEHCMSLTSLDISSFDTSNVTDMTDMFKNCRKLKHIYVGPKWDTSNLLYPSNTIFKNCERLPNFQSYNLGASKAYAGEGGYLEYKGNYPDIPEEKLNVDAYLKGAFYSKNLLQLIIKDSNEQNLSRQWGKTLNKLNFDPIENAKDERFYVTKEEDEGYIIGCKLTGKSDSVIIWGEKIQPSEVPLPEITNNSILKKNLINIKVE